MFLNGLDTAWMSFLMYLSFLSEGLILLDIFFDLLDRLGTWTFFLDILNLDTLNFFPKQAAISSRPVNVHQCKNEGASPHVITELGQFLQVICLPCLLK